VHTAQGAWDEALLCHAAAPVLGAPIATGQPAMGAYVSFDVTPAVAMAQGTITFAMVAASQTDKVTVFASRRAGEATAPRLELA
jgi:hypothetical protein